MRAAILALSVVLAAGSAGAAERLPTFKRGTAYGEARTSLMALGWKPAPVPADKRFCTIGREDVCEKYAETEDCSGTGLGFCQFTWSKGGRLIMVVTAGEEVEHLGVWRVSCRAGC